MTANQINRFNALSSSSIFPTTSPGSKPIKNPSEVIRSPVLAWEDDMDGRAMSFVTHDSRTPGNVLIEQNHSIAGSTIDYSVRREEGHEINTHEAVVVSTSDKISKSPSMDSFCSSVSSSVRSVNYEPLTPLRDEQLLGNVPHEDSDW